MQFCCCNLSPRGDGNNRGDLSKRQIFPVAIYPREGTETMRTMSSHTLSSVAIYPREGTETSSPSASGGKWGKSLQFIPARGRKQFQNPTSHHRCGCNLSPRGDGNPPINITGFVAIRRLQFIPARGRKPVHINAHVQYLIVAIYPREGTETVQSHVFTSSRQHRCNLSPRGDGNVERQRFSHDFRVAIYPREGTETSVVSWTYTAFWVAIYPREGTETFPCWLISCWKWLQFIPARGRKLRHYFSCDN